MKAYNGIFKSSNSVGGIVTAEHC